MTRTPWLRRLALFFWTAGLVSLVAVYAAQAVITAFYWDLAETDRPGRLAIYNHKPLGGDYGMPVEIGDYDADGHPDLAIAPMAAPSGPADARLRAGEVYVYRGDGVIAGTMDRGAMGTSPPGLTLWGARKDDFFGTEMFSADVNGDGIADLLIGAQNYDGPAGDRHNSGGVFIILGRPGLLGTPDAPSVAMDMASPPPGVITIFGRQERSRLGIWVESADMDGDGISDLLLGADLADGPDPAMEKEWVGEVVVVYGRANFPPVIDLAHADPDAFPVEASFIYGRDPFDHFGACIHARDLDRDGHTELIVGAAINRRSGGWLGEDVPGSAGTGGADGYLDDFEEAGEVYVIFGDGGRLPARLDMAQLPGEFSNRVTTIYGEVEFSHFGEEIASGDFNGDGFPDLAVGALSTNSPAPLAGATFIIYWNAELRGVEIVTTSWLRERIEGHPDVFIATIRGNDTFQALGDTLAAADFDRDGFDDLVVGVPHQEALSRAMAGSAVVFFGRKEHFPIETSVVAPVDGLRLSYVYGELSGDTLSYSMEARDYDGDGYTDLFPNAMRSNGAGGAYFNAGAAYVLSGFHLSNLQVEADAVNPSTIRTGTETLLRVHGQGFTRDDDTRVFVDGVGATDVKVVSSSTIECRLAPRQGRGRVPLRVENRHGTATIDDAISFLEPGDFIRGDANGDAFFDISDPLATLGYLFQGAPADCLDRLDSNDDGQIDISDPIHSLTGLFLGGDLPRPPHPDWGPDPTPDSLNCP